MGAKVTHEFNEKQIYNITQGPNSGLLKDMLKRGARVQTRARRNLRGGATGPRRINTGALSNSIKVAVSAITNTHLAVRVGSNLDYAVFVHDGTGIYGPRKTKILPKRGRALVFRSKIYGAKRGRWRGFVVVRSVKGMKPNPFLREALSAFRNTT